jgi:hypothetical protein
MPLGNSMHDNILIGCEKPFSVSKDVQEEWLDRKNNVVWSMEDCPQLIDAKANGGPELAKLQTLWQDVPGFPSIPVERIGLRGQR